MAFYGLWPGMTFLELWLEIADEHEELLSCGSVGECYRCECAGCGHYGWVQMDCPPQRLLTSLVVLGRYKLCSYL
ncbi:hypothetical protein DEO72_LG1g2514 [Vigna unguiculata]|uniref:Uncharacterized protein n=1 Tax=Vigna unguiculata TaxID=3917 RepID=A0A4D6KML6_VIGUN|nr:hypothetical protein DEO72_LG1g2514 [Vigna unguiculata]